MAKKIAFVSCAYATHRDTQPAWKEILAAEPDVLLMLGDNAYMSWYGSKWDFKALEDCYRAQSAVKEFRAVIDSVPTLAVWDDHDCGPDDTLGAEAPPEHLAKTRELFDRWMGFARNNNPPHMYCTYNDLPDVKIVMLDVRTYRTSSAAEPATLLGAAQEMWLWEQLDPDTTPQKLLTIVASGTGFSIGKPGHRVNDYKSVADGIRSRLAFQAGGAGSVGRRALFLGGDVHYNKFVTHKAGLYEAISSGVACFLPQTYTENDFVRERYSDNWGLITIGDDRVQIDFSANAHTKGNPSRRVIDIESWTVAKN